MPTFQFPYDIRNSLSTAGFLSIDTDMLQMVIEGGAVVYLKDKAANEVLINTDSASWPKTYIGYSVWTDLSSVWAFEPRNAAVAWNGTDTLTYGPLYNDNAQVANTYIEYHFDIDATGEVVISLKGHHPGGVMGGGNFAALTDINFSIFNFEKTGGVILGNGRKWTHSDAAYTDKTRLTDSWYAPSMAVACGDDCILSVWSESTRYLDDLNIILTHTTTYDHLALHEPNDPKQHNNVSQLDIYAGPWRIGTYSDWWTAAKRWRVCFEDRESTAGVAPLWNNRCEWVRNIHVSYGGILWQDSGLYATLDSLATDIPPAKTLYFSNNNGASIVLGDPQYKTWGQGGPLEPDIASMKSRGYHTVLYYHWAVIDTHTFATWKLTHPVIPDGGASDALPEGYIFTPDYVDPANDDPGFYTETTEERLTDWNTYWSDINCWPGANWLYSHPGATKFKEFFLHNYPNFCSIHNMDGAYFDTLGAAMQHPLDLVGHGFFDGVDYYTGERNTLSLGIAANNDLPIYSEYPNAGLLPYIFATWEGADSALSQSDSQFINPPPSVPISHPLRTALLGSYFWSRGGAGGLQYNLRLGVMLGFGIVGDGIGFDSAQAAFSQTVCKLYCKFNLFHDIPAVWKESVNGYETLAYFRSSTGNSFRCENRGSDVTAWVEEHWQGDYDRLIIDDGVITTNNIDEELPSILYSRYNYAVLPTDDADLTTIYTTEDISDVAADDTDMVPQLATSQIAIHQFKQQINGTGGIINVVAQVTIPCSTSTAYLQIYNRSGTPAWDTIDSDNATGANTDFTLSATVTDLTDYKDANDIVACRVYQEMQ